MCEARPAGATRPVSRQADWHAPPLRGGTVGHKTPSDFGQEKRAFHLFQKETPSGAAADKMPDTA